MWIVAHCDIGPLLLCVWGRPLDHGKVAGVHSLTAEFEDLAPLAVGSHCWRYELAQHAVAALLAHRNKTGARREALRKWFAGQRG
eukprot:7487515-Alexandrium_andersonii.AAC.1